MINDWWVTKKHCFKCGMPIESGTGGVGRFSGRWQSKHKTDEICDAVVAKVIDEENERLKLEVAQFGCVT